ncbi:MAG: alpha/beta hydrolase [Ilumatobacteraceae bacterium]
MGTVKRDVEFVSGGLTLRGWLFVPEGPGPHPALVVTNGFGSVKELFLDHPYHQVFADAGFVVLVYDHPYCGESDGLPRLELDPIAQQRAYRDGITFLCTQPEVDASRIGIWGTSYSGGHVLTVAAHDRRVKCVVSQCFTVSGARNQLRRYTPDGLADMRRRWDADRLARARGEEAETVQQVPDTAPSAAYYAALPPELRAKWPNRITLKSLEMYGEYEPAAIVDRISPTPLLMIVALEDVTTMAEDCLEAYSRALEPKKLVTFHGDHYAFYTTHFPFASEVAREWFVEHLQESS